jgi:hypothetical protein
MSEKNHVGGSGDPWLQPTTGVLILALDWALFGGNALTAGALAPLWIAAGALLAGGGTYLIQRRGGKDTARAAAAKAILAGALVAVPFPVAGTFAGSVVLGAAGLSKALRGRRR